MNNTFLPEDYLKQKAERRTNIVCVALFVVVMLTVFGAFLVSNRQWSQVRDRRHAINIEYERVALQIEELSQLETQKQSMLHKAELASALIERVPRSILIAELINRMPPELGLVELHLESTKVKRRAAKPSSETRGSLKKRKAKRGKTREEAAVQQRKVEAPVYETEIVVVGVAPSDIQVARYKGSLSQYPLLRNVSLVYTQEKNISGRRMREFRIKMFLVSNADVRTVEPLKVPRIRNPMLDTMRIGPSVNAPPPASTTTTRQRSATALPVRERGD